MTKTLIVSQYYWPEDFRINDLSQILKEHGHDVTVLTGQPNYPLGTSFTGYRWWKFSTETHAGVKIYRVPLWPRRNGRAIHLALNYLSFMLFSLLSLPFFLLQRFDFVLAFGTSPIFQGISGGVLAKIKRIPFYIWVLDLWPESLSATNTFHNKILLGFVLKIVRFYYGMSDKILCVSKSFIDHIKNQNIDQNKLIYFPNWAEDLYTQTLAIKPKTLTQDFTFPVGTILTYAGNLGEAQDLEALFDAMKICCADLSDVHFLILGDGRKKIWLEEQIKKHKLQEKIHLLGRHPQEAMPYFFRQTDAFLVTLKKVDIFTKTLPGRVMSFMAVGKPLIAAAGKETENIVRQAECGFSAKPGDAQELAALIKKFYLLPKQDKDRMAQNSHDYFKSNFSRTSVYPRLKEILCKQNQA